MYKFYCDICGCETKEKGELILRNYSNSIRPRYQEICPKCARLFDDWLDLMRKNQGKQQ